MPCGERLFLTGGSGFIGTNFLEVSANEYQSILNFDISKPLKSSHRKYWEAGDILQREQLFRTMREFGPDAVAHLAARTDCDEETTVEQGYLVNTEGTRNLVDAVKNCPTVKRLIVVSTQFVCRPGYIPKHDCDFAPETIYGESKAQSELITRELDPQCTWTIVRPTNIWGPYHERYAREFWRVCSRGWYVHPAVPSPVRSYGYVGNVAWQMSELLRQKAGSVHQKVFYLGDRPDHIEHWIRGFHAALSNRKTMFRVPASALRLLALAGDAISALQGKPFYITTSRLKSMTTDYTTPMEPTFSLLGEPPWTLEEGIRDTVEWFKTYAK